MTTASHVCKTAPAHFFFDTGSESPREGVDGKVLWMEWPRFKTTQTLKGLWTHAKMAHKDSVDMLLCLAEVSLERCEAEAPSRDFFVPGSAPLAARFKLPRQTPRADLLHLGSRETPNCQMAIPETLVQRNHSLGLTAFREVGVLRRHKVTKAGSH